MNASLSFDYPYVLFALIIIIPLFFLDRFRRPLFFIKQLPESMQGKIRVSNILFRIFIALSIIAISGPRWGMGYKASEYRRGLDTVFAIDVSRSMDIYDIETGGGIYSRLDKGVAAAKESIKAAAGGRFAAAIGRSSGYLTVPLTYGSEAVLGFLETLSGSAMTGRSTNLESLLNTAANAFADSSAARKLIVLISDGESHFGLLQNAVNRCAREGIIISCVALGSDTGTPVPYADGLAAGSRGLSAEISRRDASVMRNAAERTGGVFIDGNSENAASLLSLHLLSLSQEYISGNIQQSEPKDRKPLFIILGIIAYGLSKFIPLADIKKKNKSKKRILSVILAVLTFTSCSRGSLLLMEANYLNSRGRYDEAVIPYLKAMEYDQAAPYAQYGLGVLFHSLEEGAFALERYENSRMLLESLPAGSHNELKFRNYYNSGIIFFENEDYLSAAEAFKEALRADPRRIDAKRNLELSQMAFTINSGKDDQTRQISETTEIIFDYIREHEQQYWKSREWNPEDDFSGPDY